MGRDDLKIPPGALGAAAVHLLKITAGAIAATIVVGTAIIWVLQPRAIDFLESREKPVLDAVNDIKRDIGDLKETVISLNKPVIEFQGGGIVGHTGPFMAGGRVPITFSLRRNQTCATVIEVQFWSRRLGRIDTSLTYRLPSTQAKVTAGFIDFPVDVSLPDDMRPGWYSYHPIIVPNCGEPFPAPFSEFFEVVANP